MVKAFTLLQMELKEKFRYKIEIFSASTDAILLIFPSIAILLFGNLEISGIHSKTEYIQYMLFILNYICLFDYLFISSQMSAKPYFIGSTGILLLW